MLQTDVLIGANEIIDRIAGEWAELCSKAANGEPFERPEWFAAFVRNFEREIRIITVRRDGELLAVLPLARKVGLLHGVPVRKLQAVFNLNTPRFDLIHTADESLRKPVVKAVWKAIRDIRGWDVLETRLVRTNSWLADILELAAGESSRTGVWEMDAAPCISLPLNADNGRFLANFFSGSRKHLGKELDRRLRRLSELGTVEFCATSRSTAELIRRYFDLEASGWKGRRGTAVNDDPRVARFHDEFALALANNGTLVAYELKLDAKTIAMSLNIRMGGKTIHWKTSYDENYARYAPGNLLFRELLCDCVRDGSAEIDFLSPSTPNKRTWATGEREHAAFYVFRPGLFGSLLSGWKFGLVGRFRYIKQKALPIMQPAYGGRTRQ